jgi:hypothetical protein
LGYIERNLRDGEKIIATAHLHPIIFLWPAVLTLLFLSFGGGARWLAIIPLIWLGLVYLGYSSSEFAVTNRRIIAKWGVARTRHSVETNLDKVEAVIINQSFLGSRLNYGSIIVKGVGGSGEPFPSIANPMEFRGQILEHTTQLAASQCFLRSLEA